MRHSQRRFVLVVGALVLLCSCASEVVRQNATLKSVSVGEQARFQMKQSIHVESSSGYGRDLPAGSTWELRGSIEQGKVFRRVDGVLTVEGAQIHEGFLVVNGGRVVGFYLPVEGAFSPMSQSVAVDFQQ